ncbi:MAG: cobalamin-binding protein [Gammaproteobacteria bacterium]|nr:cobalamin-binding protein [Gammaproteobacteria bacterium]
MKLRVFLLWTLVSAPLSAAEVNDALGRPVVLSEPARRIVSLAPHATELLFAAGAGERVVGVVERSDYPPEARDLPRIGNYTRLDLEAILALKPDLVVAWHGGNSPDTLSRLQALGLTLYLTETGGLSGIPRDIRALGDLLGTQRTANQAARHFEDELAALRQKYREQRPVRVFYQIWTSPLMTLNGKTMVSEVISLCGGVNIFDDEPILAPSVDIESVLQRRPQAIIASGMAAERPEWLQAWRDWDKLPAVRYNALYHIHPDLIQRQGPRILEGAKIMCANLSETRRKMNEEGNP